MHVNTIQIKENKQLNIQQKQNYPGSVASYDTQPGNEVGLFYNGPEHHTGQTQGLQSLQNVTQALTTLKKQLCKNAKKGLKKI